MTGGPAQVLAEDVRGGAVGEKVERVEKVTVSVDVAGREFDGFPSNGKRLLLQAHLREQRGEIHVGVG